MLKLLRLNCKLFILILFNALELLMVHCIRPRRVYYTIYIIILLNLLTTCSNIFWHRGLALFLTVNFLLHLQLVNCIFLQLRGLALLTYAWALAALTMKLILRWLVLKCITFHRKTGVNHLIGVFRVNCLVIWPVDCVIKCIILLKYLRVYQVCIWGSNLNTIVVNDKCLVCCIVIIVWLAILLL